MPPTTRSTRDTPYVLQEGGTNSMLGTSPTPSTLSSLDTTQVSAHKEPLVPEKLAAIRERLAQLQELRQLEEREKELHTLLGIGTDNQQRKTKERTRQESDASSVSSCEIEVKNIPELRQPTTPQKRQEWLNDLNCVFNRARRRFKKDYQKILIALDYIQAQGRARWERYLDELPKDRRDAAENDWDLFQEWTLTLLKGGANYRAHLAIQRQNAKQREGQSPMEFSLYLDSIENCFERALESERAYTYFGKLLPGLQRQINLYKNIEDHTREEIVQLAQRLWDATEPRPKRRLEAKAKGRLQRAAYLHQPVEELAYRQRRLYRSRHYTKKPQP
ncbi:hypothetical protein DCS_08294 [Drechmeria coniospora]|uniref:Uncharacterized protein n=1 Tax=Drechmeria coniospora TaxID=98403 RepID=A0A151G9S5_DRECN|nr:uncharacterized protein DCS_08294 [Drechmeria coniospora]KYK53933.1 hypothetical protein DCS_08294 [Drechmeria coniospora]